MMMLSQSDYGAEIYGLVALAIVSVSLIVVARFHVTSVVTMAVALITVALITAWALVPPSSGMSSALLPLIGTGLGGLIAALTAVFRQDDNPDEPPADE